MPKPDDVSTEPAAASAAGDECDAGQQRRYDLRSNRRTKRRRPVGGGQDHDETIGQGRHEINNEVSNKADNGDADEDTYCFADSDPEQDLSEYPDKTTVTSDVEPDTDDAASTATTAGDMEDPGDYLGLEDVCSDEDYEEDEDAADEDDVSTLFLESLRDRTTAAVSAEPLGGDLGGTLCGRVLHHYESMGDHDRATSVFTNSRDIGPQPLFDTVALRKIFAYACASGGAGLSRIEIYDYYGVLCATERAARGSTPFKDRFKTKSAFFRAIRNEKRRTLKYLGWRYVTHFERESPYKIHYVDGLDVIQDLCLRSSVIRFDKDDVRIVAGARVGGQRSGQGPRADGPPDHDETTDQDRRRGPAPGHEQDLPRPAQAPSAAAAAPLDAAALARKNFGRHDPGHTGLMDGVMFKKQLEDVNNSPLLPPGTKMLAVMAYSDGTCVTSNGGKHGREWATLSAYLWSGVGLMLVSGGVL